MPGFPSKASYWRKEDQWFETVSGGFLHHLRTKVVTGVKGWLMLSAGVRQERSITNTGVADGGPETRFFRKRLAPEVTILDVKKGGWCSLYDFLLG